MTDSAEASATMQQAKRILLIGLGRWGANHLRVLQSMPVELYVADTDAERLNSSGVPQSHRTADARSFFPIVDAAVVVTPAQSHFEICRGLLEAGKDVFVEKPITSESADARKLVELAKRSGLVVQVGHIFRFDPASGFQWGVLPLLSGNGHRQSPNGTPTSVGRPRRRKGAANGQWCRGKMTNDKLPITNYKLALPPRL